MRIQFCVWTLRLEKMGQRKEDVRILYCLDLDNCFLKTVNNCAVILCYFTTFDRLCIKKRMKIKKSLFNFQHAWARYDCSGSSYNYLAEDTRKYSPWILLREEFQSNTLCVCVCVYIYIYIYIYICVCV